MERLKRLGKRTEAQNPAFGQRTTPTENGPDLVTAATRPPRPVVLARKERERGRDWTHDRSWFGGRPKLGNVPWPCDAHGMPLPFTAQIDLAEIARACPESPLPREGWLAFFLNDGAVVHVPPGEHEPAPLPEHLPAAYDEGGYPLPERATRTSQPLFPFWPVELIGLPLTDSLRDYANVHRHEEIWAAQHTLLSERVRPRPYAFSVFSARKDDVPGADSLWWFGVQHLPDRLSNALEGAPRLIAMAHDARRRASEHLETLQSPPSTDEKALAEAKAALDKASAQAADRERQFCDLPAFIDGVERLCAGRDPWAPLDAQALAAAKDVLKSARKNFEDLVWYHVPHSTDDLADICIRRMMTGDKRAFEALPDPMLTYINANYRLTSQSPHQMFGLAGVKQAALYEHLDDLLLLQLGYDDMNEWRFGDMGLWHFWISVPDAAARRWDKARLTFESA